MNDPKEQPLDPNEVVTLPDGSRIRPGRFVTDGEGMTIVSSGEAELNSEVGDADADTLGGDA